MSGFNDPRFSHAKSDPRFKRMTEKKSSGVVDRRFETVIKDKDFSTGGAFDKFGRKVELKSRNVQNKLSVAAAEDEDDEDSDDNKKKPTKSAKPATAKSDK